MTLAYISLDALVGWTRSDVPSLTGALGRPLVASVRSGGETFSVVRYPFAYLLVELLRSMVDRVVLFSDVEPATASRMARAALLGNFPLCAVHRHPRGYFRLDGLCVSPPDVPHVLIVAPDASAWDVGDHARVLECRVSPSYVDENGHVRASRVRHVPSDAVFPVLEVLSAVVRIVESRHALPTASVSQAVVYRRQGLLSHARFYVPPTMNDAMDLARTLDAHGAVLANDPRTATHILLPSHEESPSDSDEDGGADRLSSLREALVGGNVVRCTARGVRQACAYFLPALVRRELKPHALLAAMFLPPPAAGALPREALHRLWEHANLPMADDALWVEVAEDLRGVAMRVAMGLQAVADTAPAGHVPATECVCAVLGRRNAPPPSPLAAAAPPSSPTDTDAAHNAPPPIPQADARGGRDAPADGAPRFARGGKAPAKRHARRSESSSDESDGGRRGRRRPTGHTRRNASPTSRKTPPPSHRRASPPPRRASPTPRRASPPPRRASPPPRRASPPPRRASPRRRSPVAFDLTVGEKEAFAAMGIPVSALDSNVDAIDQYAIAELNAPDVRQHKLAILSATARYREKYGR